MIDTVTGGIRLIGRGRFLLGSLRLRQALRERQRLSQQALQLLMGFPEIIRHPCDVPELPGKGKRLVKGPCATASSICYYLTVNVH